MLVHLACNIKYEEFYETVFNLPMIKNILDEVRDVPRDYVFENKQISLLIMKTIFILLIILYI